jgi:hypothetical protein
MGIKAELCNVIKRAALIAPKNSLTLIGQIIATET